MWRSNQIARDRATPRLREHLRLPFICVEPVGDVERLGVGGQPDARGQPHPARRAAGPTTEAQAQNRRERVQEEDCQEQQWDDVGGKSDPHSSRLEIGDWSHFRSISAFSTLPSAR